MNGEFDLTNIPPDVLLEIARRLKGDKPLGIRERRPSVMVGARVWYRDKSKAQEREKPYLVEDCFIE